MNFELDYFKIEHNNVAPAQGKVLLAEPFLEDVYFKRSVVLLTSSEEGRFLGFVLNKFTDISINKMVKEFPEFNAKVSIGGPVRVDSIHFIHILGEAIPGSVQVMENLWWGGDFEVLKTLITDGLISVDQVRFFIGYSGWEQNQLESEISKNSWLVADLNSVQIMTSGNNIWKDTLASLGDRYRVWTNFPENPLLN